MINYNNILIFLIFLISNLPIYFFLDFIIRKLNFFDYNNTKRKIHTSPVSLLGGSLIFYNIVLLFMFNAFFSFDLFNSNFFNSNREYFAFFLGLSNFYLLGLYDDKYNLSANKKLFISFFVILALLKIDSGLVIKDIKFIDYFTVELKDFSILFSILCFLLFMNALNMFDGINLQVGIYTVTILIIFLFKGINISYNLYLIFTMLFFLLFNFKNKMFLGDSGSNLIFFIISYTIVKNYNLSKNFDVEEIFVLMALPGMDMLRLFILRLLKGKNPFEADKNHLHHLVLKIVKNSNRASLSIMILNTTVIFFYYMVNIKLIYILSVVILYFIIFLYLNYKIKKNEYL